MIFLLPPALCLLPSAIAIKNKFMTRELTNLPKILRIGRKARQLVLDYALGASILGLIPIGGLLTLKSLIFMGLIAKMIWDLGVIWQFPLHRDALAIAGYVAGWIGGITMAFLAWLTFFAIGIYVPYIRSFAIAAALFTLIWIIGQATNHFYQVGRLEAYSEEIK
jgi:hypothetical protein